MKKSVIYLINKKQADGSSKLVCVPGAEWYSVTLENKALPPEQRRYFVELSIEDRNVIDTVIVETTREEYLAWHREQMASTRNRAYGEEQFQLLSLDALLPADDEQDSGAGTDIPDPSAVSSMEDAATLADMERIRENLAEWKPWAVEMLDLLLDGKRRDCASILAKRYGISTQMARRYRKQFVSHIQTLLTDMG